MFLEEEKQIIEELVELEIEAINRIIEKENNENDKHELTIHLEKLKSIINKIEYIY